MREIKFRAWDKEGECWIPQDDFIIDATCGEIMTYCLIDNRYLTETIAYTLMQYTGLKDKNGVEIYEGDIVGFYKRPDLMRLEVIWKDGMFTSKYITKGTIQAKMRLQECGKDGISYTGLPSNIISTSGSPWEVMGNIYENPEGYRNEEEI